MLFLAISNLRHRWLSFVGVFVTVLAATALLTATGALLEAGIRGPAPPERLTDASIVVAADQSVSESRGTGEDHETVTGTVAERVRLPRDVARVVASVDGVHSVMEDVSFPAYAMTAAEALVTGPDGLPSLGHAWVSDPALGFSLDSGVAPSSDDEVVLDSALARRAELRVGDAVGLVVTGEPVAAQIVGVASPTSGSALHEQSAIFFTPAAASEYYGHADSIDLLGVTLDAGADEASVAAAIEDEVGSGTVVLTGDDRGKAEFLDAADSAVRLIAISGSLGGIALFVAGLVLVGMLSLFIQQRQREVALLRAVGATSRQVRRMIARETLLVTLLGAALGAWPGLRLATLLSEAMQDKGLLPGTFAIEPSIWPVAGAVTSVVLMCAAASYVAGRRASRVRPVEALATSVRPPTNVGWLRTCLGLLFAGGTAALFLVTTSVSATIAPAIAPGLLMSSIVTVGLFAPLLVRLGLAVMSVLAGRLAGVSGFLASTNSTFQSRRLASTVVPLVLTVGIAGMTLFQQSTLDSEASRQGAKRTTADYVIAAPAGLSPAAVDQLAQQGIGTVVGVTDTTVFANFDLDPYAAKAVTAGDLDSVVDLAVVDGSVGELSNGQVALSEDAAESMDLRVGQRADLRLGDGDVTSPIVTATYRQSVGFSDVLLPWAAVAPHLTDTTLPTVLVGAVEDRAAADSALLELRRDHPSIEVGGAEILAAVDDANADTQAWVNYVLLGLVIVFAAFAVLNTLMLSIRERSREFGLLQLVGTTRRQVRIMMLVEAAFLLVLGWVLGAGVAAATVMPFSKAVTGSFVPSMSPLAIAALAATTALLALVGTVVPTHATLRARPVDALGVRE